MSNKVNTASDTRPQNLRRVLAGLIWLPSWLIAGFGAILVVGHNA